MNYSQKIGILGEEQTIDQQTKAAISRFKSDCMKDTRELQAKGIMLACPIQVTSICTSESSPDDYQHEIILYKGFTRSHNQQVTRRIRKIRKKGQYNGNTKMKSSSIF